jgi:hypothetical protein
MLAFAELEAIFAQASVIFMLEHSSVMMWYMPYGFSFGRKMIREYIADQSIKTRPP